MGSSFTRSTPTLARFLRNPLGLGGSVIALLLLSAALLSPLLVRTGLLHAPNLQHPHGLDSEGFPLPPGGPFPLGTDALGRDVLSRVLHGTRISLAIGCGGILTATGIGVALGLIAGYRGGWLGSAILRFTEMSLSLPAILLAVAIAGLLDRRIVHLHPESLPWHFLDIQLSPGLTSLLFVIGFVCWPGMVRVVRAQVLALKEREYVLAARSLGASDRRIVLLHILPNLLPTVLILATMNTAYAILLEAGLGYLGLGVPQPTPAWGSMIQEGQQHLISSPHLIAVPGAALVLTVLAFNLLGQALRDSLDRSPSR